MNQAGFTLWFTGLPCSGKTTIADLVAMELRKRGLLVERLDGDIVRENLTKDLGFSKEDRDRNIERVAFVARLLSRNKVAVLASFISPYISVRDKVRRDVTNFVEVYMDCPLEVCESRDVKGLYNKARNGQIPNFTGVSDPYEKPVNPEITLKTDRETPEQCVRKVLDKLEEMTFIPKKEGKLKDKLARRPAYSENEKKQIKTRLISLGYIENGK